VGVRALARPNLYELEAVLIMTKKSRKSNQYWLIKVPRKKFPKPLFHFDQQVGIPGQDDRGNSYYDIGVITGIQYITYGNQTGKWYYRIRILKCDYNPKLVGSDDSHYIEESSLVADNTRL
jgi:hypothetical protein